MLGGNYRLRLFHTAKSFVFINETRQRINESKIGYMINPKFAFREKVDKCMSSTFGPITQPHIRATLAKSKTRVLALLMFYETINNPKSFSKVLSCFIYTIIRNYVCIDYLACEKNISKIPVNTGGGFRHGTKVMKKYWELELQIC